MNDEIITDNEIDEQPTSGTDLSEPQKLKAAERANEIYRQQLKYMQDHLASLRDLIQDKENIIENLMLRYDLGIITQDSNRQGGNLSPDEIEMEELRRKAEALAQRTILENFELREMVNELRDENFHLRNEIYELQDKINRHVTQINKLEKQAERLKKYDKEESAEPPDLFGNNEDSTDEDEQIDDDDDRIENDLKNDELTAKSEQTISKHARKESVKAADLFESDNDNEIDDVEKNDNMNDDNDDTKENDNENIIKYEVDTKITKEPEEADNDSKMDVNDDTNTEKTDVNVDANQVVPETNNEKSDEQSTSTGGVIMEDSSDLSDTQKLQLAERANEIYRQQLKYMQDHLASLRSLIQDKENIIENLVLRYDLGIITQDSNRQGGNLGTDEVEMEELRRKAEALCQRTILENFELREMVNELRDENFHLRNEIYELQDKINRQVLQINKLEKTSVNEDDIIEEDDNDIYDVEDYDSDIYADEQPNNDQLTGRRESKTMNHPANSEEAIQKRLERKAKHVRKESEKPPNLFGTSDSDNEEEYMDEQANNDRITGRRESKTIDYDQANSEEVIAKRLKRKAQTIGAAAVEHVKSHRRKESLAEKLLLAPEHDSDHDLFELYDDLFENHDDSQQLQKQRRTSEQLIKSNVDTKDHLSDKSNDANLNRSKTVTHRRDSSIATPDIFRQNYDPEKNINTNRRDSSLPIVNLGLEDPDVLLHYEKLKVQDLEKELESKLNELESVRQEKEDMTHKLQNAKNELVSLRQEIMQKQANTMKKEHDLERQLQEAKNEVASLKQERDQLKAQSGVTEAVNRLTGRRESRTVDHRREQSVALASTFDLLQTDDPKALLIGLEKNLESSVEELDGLKSKIGSQISLIKKLQITQFKSPGTEMKIMEIIYEPTEDVIKQEVVRYQAETKKYDQLNENLFKKYLPLHTFSAKQVCDKIKWWFFNDIIYGENLLKIMNILSEQELHGSKVMTLTVDNVKKMVQNECRKFMTAKTINIMFDYFGKWKQENAKHIQHKHAASIAYHIYNYPLLNLLKKMMEHDINGETFIDQLQEFIKNETGWNDDLIYQLQAAVFNHQTVTKQQFKHHIENILRNTNKAIPSYVKDVIKKNILAFDVEKLHFKINKCMDIGDFSDTIVNMVDDLIKQNDQNKEYCEDDFVKQIYELVANSFIGIVNDENVNTVLLNKQNEWICYNCSNANFIRFIGGRFRTDLSNCSLCGVTQKDSIIITLKKHDTFVMVNDIDNETENNIQNEEQKDNIDKLIQSVLSGETFNLACPNRNDNKPCPAIIELSKHLITYKRWIHTVYKKTKGNDEIEKTIQLDLKKLITDEIYKKVFIEQAKIEKRINKNDLESLTKMIENNNDIKNAKRFLNLKRSKFAKIISNNTKIKVAIGKRLYKLIMNALKKAGQTKQFGKFLGDMDMYNIESDYFHIKKAHIEHGNKDNIENVFRFFGKAIHFEDTQNIDECRSYQRRDRRMDSFEHSTDEKTQDLNNINDVNYCQDKNIWALRQYYNQSQLDIIHAYLVHSDWQHFIQRYSKQPTKNSQHDDEDDEIELVSDETTANNASNRNRYVTDSYGFGVEHSYPNLTDKYCSLRDELLCKSSYSISKQTFHNLLIKAVRVQKMSHGNQLFCKYFDKQYNIIRNEKIGIRHVLALTIYTDISSFCTAFRSTYRRLKDEDDDQVTIRHQQLYHYSRSLFEAIEFFGEHMHSKLKVYHGLNKVLYFDKFSAYFNQPVSTTTSLTTANQFSEGKGIILTLKSGTKHFNDPTKIPKFLNVSWLSSFPNEEEKLFYGAYVVFQIANIYNIQENKLRGHSKELLIFNKLQQILENQRVDWDFKKKKQKRLLKVLVGFIQQEQESNDIDDYKKPIEYKDKEEEEEEEEEHEKHEMEQKYEQNEMEEVQKYITKYGKDLFHYFCINKQIVAIQNFKLLPLQLYTSLFMKKNFNNLETKKKNDTERISFKPMVNLFPNIKQISLNGLQKVQLETESEYYIGAVIEYIRTKQENLEKIIFETNRQYDFKKSVTLKKLANNNANKFKKLKWTIEYDFRLRDTHNLIFTKETKQPILSSNISFRGNTNVKYIQSCSLQQIITVISIICSKSEKLIKHKQLFISFFKQNNVDGKSFLKFKRREFSEEIIKYGKNNNKLKEATMQLFNGLYQYKFKKIKNVNSQRTSLLHNITQSETVAVGTELLEI